MNDTKLVSSCYISTLGERFVSYWSPKSLALGILTWRRGYHDQEGGSSRMRPFHCTTVGLTPANAPNVGISGA